MDRRLVVFYLPALGVVLALAVFLSPFASEAPDGLERVAEDHGFSEKASEAGAWNAAPLPGYNAPGLSGGWSKGLAGGLGTLVALGVGLALARALARKKTVPSCAAARDGPGAVSGPA